MSASESPRSTLNYAEAEGAVWVIGGKLVILPGATVEGNILPSCPAVADSEATTVASLRSDLNALIAALRDAGVIAAPAAE